jgi:three-Cys-motif partner protein
MSDNLNTIWEIEPHTEAKHVILRHYLKAWFPILGRWNDRILFMDGYAGPGEYANGEIGSPIIAIKEAMNYLNFCDKTRLRKPEVVFIFIEQDKKRFETLQKKIGSMRIPKEISIKLINSTFEEVTSDILESLENQKTQLAPAFLFIDPFGYNLPFELIQRLMKNDKCEVFINFMYEFINRFITRDGQEKVMTRLFGTDEWRELGLDRPLEPTDRRNIIHDFYLKQLETRAAKYVRSFELKGNRNTTKYFLFYGTKHKLGLSRMKEAMWRVDTGGTFTFSDATNPRQTVLFGDDPDYDYLKSLIINRFSGKHASIEMIEEFVLCETPFLPSHIKKPILVPLEKSGEIEVLTERKRKNTYPERTIIRFNNGAR